MSLDLEARGEHGTVRIEGSETDGTGNYEVFVNGELFATITITAGARAGGQQRGRHSAHYGRAPHRAGGLRHLLRRRIFFEDLLEPVAY